MDFTALTAAVDFSDVLIAMGAIAAIIATVRVARVGISMVLRSIRS